MSAILQVIPEDLNPVDLGEVFECEESVKDCLIVASTAQPTIGRKVLLVLFGKHNSLIAGADIQLEWSIGAPVKRVKRVRHSAIFNHAFAFVPGEAGLLEITVTARNPVTGETRTLNVVLYVRRPYPLFEYLKKLTKVHDQWALRNARTLINFSRSIIGVGDPIHIQRPEDISPDEIRKNSGLLARNLFLLDPSNISFDGDRKMTEHLISQYAAHFDAANLSSISDDKRPPKELLIGIVSVSLRQSGEIEKESIRELRMIDGLMFKYHGSILSIHHGPLLHRLAAVSLVAGPKGLSAPTAALISGNLILAEHSLLNEPSSITSRRMIELLSSFPKSAVRVAYALIKQIKSELHPSKTTAQLLGDEPAMREIATEYFRLMLGPELRVDEHAFDHIPNIPATGYNLYWSVKQFAEEAIKLSQAPETMVIARGGLEARNVSTRVDQNGKVTQSLDYAHPYKAEFPWALRPISALYDEHDQSTLSKTLSWSGEHFGWDISADVNEDAKNAIISDVETWQMVLLDVGFWGDYDRNNPQRNFGMIEGRHIWLCSLIYKNSEVKEVHGETLARFRKVYSAARLSAPSLVERILKAVAEWGYTIEIISYTYAPTPPVPQTHPDVNTFLPEGKLKLIFPDMHLPEQWPDIPTEGSRIQDEQIRRSLTRLLKTVQTSGGVHRESVHNYLAALAAHQLDNQNPLPGSFSVPGYGPVVDPIQFDAEYRFVERKIRLDASWFYPPRAVKPKIHDSIEELFADPSPAIDLAALLTAVIDLNCADIDMVQVGDLYEMWMGHEWLYKDFPPLDDINSEFPDALYVKFADISDWVGLSVSQYRLEKDWHSYVGWEKWLGSPELKDVKRSLHTTWNQSLNDSIPFDDSIPMYPHHEWPISLMINRRRTGLSDPLINFPQEQSGVVGRAKTEVQRRVSSIESFSLPWPMDTDWPNGPELSRKKALTRLKARYLNSYTRSTETGGEFLWNRLIIDLLRQKKCAMINGNHDCYRGDPILKGMDVTWEVESWYSKDGVWIEHGHRWDAYNQDGMPFGAAVTNQAHYNMRPLIQNSDKAKSAILPTFHEETIPSCAQWFLMVNGRSQKGSYYPTPYFQQTQSNIVNPFSVYVVGHSHNPDLLTVSFKRN